MSRPRAHECPVNVDLPVDLVDELDEFLERTGMKKKVALELAVRRFLRTETKERG